MLDYGGSGQSVMEMSHRSSVFQSIIDRCEALLRELMGIPEDYAVLFLQGGASTQFAMVPLNLAVRSGKADYVLTGQWAKKRRRRRKTCWGKRMSTSPVRRPTRPSPISRRKRPFPSRRRRTTSTSASITRSTAPSTPTSPHGGCAPRCRYLVDDPLPAAAGGAVRAALRRRAEEYGPGGADRRHREKIAAGKLSPRTPTMLRIRPI